ncbi:MAG: gamma-butyrobetaine hydroxylase-like domain-containing protein, partial [Pseudomonadota bacterium]
LRVMSPSAEVQGHSPDQKKTLGGKRDVTISAMRPVGNYAVRIVFSDGHESGIFSWRYLRELDENRETLWADHLAELQRLGLER